MHPRSATFLLLLGAVLAVAAMCSTAESQQADPAKDDQQTVGSKAQKNPMAATIDFKKELGLPYGSLSTLGSRIDSARRGHDPVSLAHAASELAVAEKVSGKKSSLTSTAVLKEAAELAGMKRQVAELKTLQQVSQQISA